MNIKKSVIEILFFGCLILISLNFVSAFSGCLNLSDENTFEGRMIWDADSNRFNVTSNFSLCEQEFVNESSNFAIQAEGITFDCNGSTIYGEGTSSGVYSEYSNTRILNCIFINFTYSSINLQNSENNSIENTYADDGDYGIYFYNVSDSLILNSTGLGLGSYGAGILLDNCVGINITNSYAIGAGLSSSDTVFGLRLWETFNSTFSGMVINSSVSDGLYMDISEYNVFENSNISAYVSSGSSYSAISIMSSPNNNFTDNNIFGTIGFYIGAGGSGCNIWRNNITADIWVDDRDFGEGDFFNNSLEGNRYYLLDGTSASEIFNLTDNNNDGWADSGEIPINSSSTVINVSCTLSSNEGTKPSCNFGGNGFSGVSGWDSECREGGLYKDNNWSTGCIPSEEGQSYYEFSNTFYNIPYNISITVATNISNSTFDLNPGCLVYGENYYVVYKINASADASKLNVYCQFEDYGDYHLIGEINGTNQFNDFELNYYTPQHYWIGSGDDWHPWIGNVSEEEENSNVEEKDQQTSSGGSGYAPQTYYSDDKLPLTGNNFGLRYNDKIKFIVNFTNHTLTMSNFNSTTAKVLIQSEPITAYLQKEILYEFDLNNDSLNDVKIIYGGMNKTKANIFIQEIVYPSEESRAPVDNKEIISNSPEPKSIKDDKYLVILILVIIIAVIGIVLFFTFHKHHKKRRNHLFEY